MTSTAIGHILRSPLYLGATAAMFLSSLGYAAAAPQIGLFMVRELGASLPTAGLYYLTSLTAPVAGFLVGARSDRTGRRLGLFRLCAVVGFIGWLGMAFATQVWMPFVITALVLCFSGASASQLFAAVRDELDRHPGGVDDGVLAFIRMSMTAGWVVGPVAGAAVAAQLGLRPLLIATAVCTLIQIAPLGFKRAPRPFVRDSPKEGIAATAQRAGIRPMMPLLIFTGLYVLIYAGEPIKYGFLPIYMTEQLHASPTVIGAAIGIQPLVELIIMPFSVVIARRIGTVELMAIGAFLGVLANLCFALTGSVVGMFIGQTLMGGVWGVLAVLGIIVALRLLPSAVATASAIFMSAIPIASGIGGLTGGIGVAGLGLPYVFVLPAALALLSAVGLAIMARSGMVPK